MHYDLFSDLPRIATALMCEPWMILPAHHRSLVEQLVAFRASEQPVSSMRGKSTSSEEAPEGYVNRITTFDKESGLAIMDVSGVMGKGLSNLAMMCGGVDMNYVHDGLEKLAELKPGAVQLYLNTPGGSVNGTQEAAAAVEEFARAVAPVHAYVDRMSASGGAFLGSGATTIMAAPTATLGSIGVYSAMMDQSARYAAEGVKVHLFTSGPLKGAGTPGVAATPAQLAERQREVDEMAQLFFGQMVRRQPGNRAALDPMVHFTGGHWQAQSKEGSALHDGIMMSRSAHLKELARTYGRTSKARAR